jgi:hypothetical protein
LPIWNSSTVDRPHILPSVATTGHRQAGDADVEDGLRRGVDDAQAHPLAGRNRPVQFSAGRGR